MHAFSVARNKVVFMLNCVGVNYFCQSNLKKEKGKESLRPAAHKTSIPAQKKKNRSLEDIFKKKIERIKESV